MGESVIDRIIVLRGQLSELLPEASILTSFLGIFFILYLLVVIGYILDLSAEGLKERKWWGGLIGLVKAIGFNLFLYACIFLGVFILPDSAFAIFFKENTNLMFVSFVILVIAESIACIVGLAGNAVRTMMAFHISKGERML